MTGLFLVVFIIVLITLIVEIAATALKMTGMDIHTARFQALSAITGTGFTTKETELIMRHRQRRGIVMALMVIGPICFLGMLSSFLVSIHEKFILDKLLIVLVFVAFLLLFTRNPRFVAFFHKIIEKELKRYKYPRRVQLEEILQLSSDFGVYEFKVTPHSRFVHKQLLETDFKEKGFIVLAIERVGQLLAIPKATDEILAEDVLVIFGQLKNIKEITEGPAA